VEECPEAGSNTGAEEGTENRQDGPPDFAPLKAFAFMFFAISADRRFIVK
jgi:hypothetical protein